MTDVTEAKRPFLTLPWQGGFTGWIVVFGAILAELIGSVIVGNMPTAIAAPVLAGPVVIAAGFAAVQWQQVRSSRAEPASWWHMAGIAAALFMWLAWPITPAVLTTVSGAHDTCVMLYSPTPACLSRVTAAMHDSDLVWWVTLVLIGAAALLARRSRIAAWAAIPVAFAGCTLAAHFLELLLIHYHFNG